MRPTWAALGVSLWWPLAVASAAAPAPARAPGPGDLAAIQARGTLRVLVILDDEREFFSGEAGERPGLDYELLEGFARLQKVKLELVPAASWEALIPALRRGDGDLIAGRFTVTEARRQQIDFTVETFPTRNIVVTRRPHRRVLTLDELRQERVSVVKGTSMSDLLPSLGVPAAHIDRSIPTGGVLAAMSSGKITCTIHEVYTAILAQKADPDIQLGTFVGPPLSLAYGVRKTDTELRAALDAHITGVRGSAMWSRLVVKYFGDSALDVLKKSREQ